jgi:hypothetical protein
MTATNHQSETPQNDGTGSVSPALERHYSVNEIAELWGLSPDATRRMFRNEPGVVEIRNKVTHKRRYGTLRIPESVVERVHRKLCLVTVLTK